MGVEATKPSAKTSLSLCLLPVEKDIAASTAPIPCMWPWPSHHDDNELSVETVSLPPVKILSLIRVSVVMVLLHSNRTVPKRVT